MSAADDSSLVEAAELLYGTVFLVESGALEDPARFAGLLADPLTRTYIGREAALLLAPGCAGGRGPGAMAPASGGAEAHADPLSPRDPLVRPG